MLLAQLADGLHAMAQPLTILRGAAGAMQMSERAAPEDRHYVDMFAVQVGRLCDLIAKLRSILDAAQFTAARERVDLQELAGPIVQDYAALLQQSGVRITMDKMPSSMPVFADAARTEQAMRAALDTAVAHSSRGDEIQCRILPDGFVLKNDYAHGRGLSSSDRLALSLVEAAILSQQGTYRFTEDPFRLSIGLPKAGTDITSECLTTAV